MNEKQKSLEVIPKEITELLEHRATLGKWLAKLEELSGTVRPEVYDRVRSDYEERLRSQETELAAHRSEMEMALEERQTRVTVLESDRDERAAELEEAELRFAVGEFKEAEFQKRKAEHEEKLATLNAELTADQEALEQLKDVVGVLGSLRAAGSASGAAASSGPGTARSAESAEPSWGTARGRAEGGVEGAVERTASAAAAAILDSGETIAESVEAARSGPEGEEDARVAALKAKWAEAKRAAEPKVSGSAGLEEAAERQMAEVTAEPKAGEAMAEGAAEPIAESPAESPSGGEDADYLDDLEFLESLSMDEIDRLDAVSAMLEHDTEAEGEEKSGESR